MNQEASFELSNTAFGQFFFRYVSSIGGTPLIWGGQKVTRQRKKVKKNPFFSSIHDAKWNKKMCGRSFVITCGVIVTLHTL